MTLGGSEIAIITVIVVVVAVWTLILLFDWTGVSKRPVFSALVLVILGLLGVVFYGIHEDKSNLWWIIPTVGISLITLILVFRIQILRAPVVRIRREEDHFLQEINRARGEVQEIRRKVESGKISLSSQQQEEYDEAVAELAEATNEEYEIKMKRQPNKKRPLSGRSGVKFEETPRVQTSDAVFDHVTWNPKLRSFYDSNGKPLAEKSSVYVNERGQVVVASRPDKSTRGETSYRYPESIRTPDGTPYQLAGLSPDQPLEGPMTYNTETEKWSSDQYGTIEGVQEITKGEDGQIYLLTQSPEEGRRIVLAPSVVFDQEGNDITGEFKYQEEE